MLRLLREPLLQFLGIAALLFVSNAYLAGDEREVITVDAATRDYLVQQRRDLLLRPLTTREESDVIDKFVKDEILVREARKRGFGNSSRIRIQLIQNMRFFLTSEIPEPTEEDLRVFFEENVERFETKPTIRFEHVFFSNPDNVPDNTLGELRAGADYRQLGNKNMAVQRELKVNQREIAEGFEPGEASKVLAIDDEDWHGPFLSAGGAHFLRVIERYPAVLSTFETAENWLETEWRMAKNREIVDTELAVIKRNYRIEIAEPETE